MRDSLRKQIAEGAEIICICEGSSEKAIVEILLENHLLIFNERDLVGDKVWFGPYYRKGSNFKLIYDSFLSMSGMDNVIILLIQDNDDKYKLSKKYMDKIDSLVYIITRPELEILYVHELDLYKKWEKFCIRNKKTEKKLKPSIFLAEELGMDVSKIKNYDYIKKFYEHRDICNGLKLYKEKRRKTKELTLLDLIE